MRITSDPYALDLDQWPRDVDLIISALHAAGSQSMGRRLQPRRRHRVIAWLSLFCNTDQRPNQLYVRDCTAHHLGFITAQPVPLGYGGNVEFLGPDQQPLSIACVVHRCRECVPGWYEGALRFNRSQPDLRFPD